MRRIGVYERVGWKFGAWHDVAWYGMRIAEPSGAAEAGRPASLPAVGASVPSLGRSDVRELQLGLLRSPSRGASMMRSMARRAWKAEP